MEISNIFAKVDLAIVPSQVQGWELARQTQNGVRTNFSDFSVTDTIQLPCWKLAISFSLLCFWRWSLSPTAKSTCLPASGRRCMSPVPFCKLEERINWLCTSLGFGIWMLWAWLFQICSSFLFSSQLDCKWRPHKPSFSPPHPKKSFKSVGSRTTNGHRKNNSSEWGCPQVCCNIFPQGDGLGILEDVLKGSGVTDPYIWRLSDSAKLKVLLFLYMKTMIYNDTSTGLFPTVLGMWNTSGNFTCSCYFSTE